MFEILVKYNNDTTNMGWGFDKHEDDLFFKKHKAPDSPMICLARLKRINDGFCNWFSMYIYTDKYMLALENKLWVSRHDSKVYFWDLVGCIKKSNSEHGFYGFTENIQGLPGVIRIMASIVNIMLSYRAGDLGGYRMEPLDFNVTRRMQEKWVEAGKSHDEPIAFSYDSMVFDTLVSGQAYDATLQDLLMRADFPKQVLVIDGMVIDFYTEE